MRMCRSEYQKVEWCCGLGGGQTKCLIAAAGGVNIIYLYLLPLSDPYPDQPWKGTG